MYQHIPQRTQLVDVDGSSHLSADSQPKSIGLV